MPDKFKATWISHSSLSDYIKCPRSYYLKNVYKNPDTNRKIMIVSPALSLGVAVHDVLEPLARLNPKKRSEIDLRAQFDKNWENYSGKIGGFTSEDEERDTKYRGYAMLENVRDNMEPLLTDCTFIDMDLPYLWLSTELEIILCGKIDWMCKTENGVHIIDFKTGKNEEKEDSLQLPIYAFMAKALLNVNDIKISYWYIDSQQKPTLMKLPNLQEAKDKILEIATQIKNARQTNTFKCPRDGCYSCRDFEKVLAGEAEYLGVGDFNKDLYFVNS